MCTYLTLKTPLEGSALGGAEDWFALEQAVVSFDHPVDALVDHALCIDFRGASSRVAVELDASSARALAASIVAALDSDEARVLQVS